MSDHALESDQHRSSSVHDITLRLQQTFVSCSDSIEAGDFQKSNEAVSDLVDFLNSISNSIVSEQENENSENTAFGVLSGIHGYISSPSLDQAVMDALSFELPKAVARFGCASTRCMEVAESIIIRFIETCSPRDMLSIICEAIGSPSKTFRVSGYLASLLTGLSKVFLSIQRRHFEQFKAAVPVILNALKAACLEADDEDPYSCTLFIKVMDVANSVQAVCQKLDGQETQKLQALFSLFILQILAIVSIKTRDEVSGCLPVVLQLSHFFHYCGLSYLDLISGCHLHTITRIAVGDDEDDYMNCFSHVKHGAALAVVWGHMSNEVAVAAAEDLTVVHLNLRNNQTKRWQALGMLKYIFSCTELPWELKKHAINFILCIMDENVSHSHCDEHIELSFYTPSLYATLQALQKVIIYASDAGFRKNAFLAFKKVLADVPTSLRFDILVALIKNNDTSSMIAILLGCFKDEMHMEYRQRNSIGNDGILQSQKTTFWNADVLELVESVLRPPKGGPPSLPEFSDAVLSALNLYRFVLMTESAGKTNYSGVLSKGNLEKAYNEWLLPLRTLVTGIVAENDKEYEEIASVTVCALNPVELVLYRCLELVEEKLKQSLE